MSSEEFVTAVKQSVSDSAGDDIVKNLRQPPGRRPAAKLLRLSQWFTGLSLADQEMIREVAQDAAESAVFGVFCILDGVRASEDGPEKGELELYYIKGSQRVLLNDSAAEMLHDIFQSLLPHD